jgi:hypothetical protein
MVDLHKIRVRNTSIEPNRQKFNQRSPNRALVRLRIVATYHNLI